MSSPFTITAEGSRAHGVDAAAIASAVRLLFAPGACHELRPLPARGSRLVSADDPEGVARVVGEIEADTKGVYFTLNPVRPELGDRAAKNGDVVSRRWLFIDVDPAKAEGFAEHSATDAEKDAASKVALAIFEGLAARGWPDPVVIDSGNGWYLLYRVDLSNDEASAKLSAAVLKALAKAYDTAEAHIDKAVHNASRIAKLPGTWARKGPSMPDRPHRLCRVMIAPEAIGVVTAEQLAEVAGKASPDPAAETNGSPFLISATNGDGRQDAYARSAVMQELARLAMASVGDRNILLNETSFKIGTLIGAGAFDRASAEAQLSLVAGRIGLGESEIRKTIRSGLEAGIARPRTLPDLNGHHHANGNGNGKAAVAAIVAGPAEWGEPILDIAPPAVPFPVEALPSPLADFVIDAARALGCPADYLGLACLVVASGAVGRSLAIGLKEGWVESPSLYGAIVGDPGMTKSPALSLAGRPLWGITEELIRQHRDDVKAANEAHEEPPPARRLAVDDATVEALAGVLRDNPRGLIMLRDELTAWVAGLNQYKQGKGTDRQFFLSAWSGSPVVVDRKGQQDRGPIVIPRPFLSVLGALTPGMLTELNEAKNRDDGFLDRLLFAMPEPIRPRWCVEGLDPDLMATWDAAVRRLWTRPMLVDGDGRERPFIAHLSADGSRTFGAWYDRHNDEAEAADFPAYLRGPWAKFRAYCGRLALLSSALHAVFEPEWEPAAFAVTAAAVADGIVLTEYFKAHTRRVRSLLRGAGSDNDDARAMLRWFRTTGRREFSERDARRNFVSRFEGDTRALADAIAWMIERRCVRPAAAPKSGRGRPHSPMYEVNPALFEPPD